MENHQNKSIPNRGFYGRNSGVQNMKRAIFSVAIACGVALMALPTTVDAKSGNQSVLDGFGSDIPLYFAVRQIVPEGKAIVFGEGIDQDKIVSWSGGADWLSILKRTATDQGLTVQVDGDVVRLTKTGVARNAVVATDRTFGGDVSKEARGGFVMVPYQPPSPAQPEPKTDGFDVDKGSGATFAGGTGSGSIEIAASASGKTSGMPTTVSVRDIPVKVLTGSLDMGETWTAESGMTLHQVLGDWSDRAGWTLVYQSEMVYQLQATADFKGDFLTAAGYLIKSIQADPQPIATFYTGNNALVISNNQDQVN